jgi:hypothetical protein
MSSTWTPAVGSVTELSTDRPSVAMVAERVHQAGLRDVQDTLRILGDPRETVQITVLSELQLVSKAIFS